VLEEARADANTMSDRRALSGAALGSVVDGMKQQESQRLRVDRLTQNGGCTDTMKMCRQRLRSVLNDDDCRWPTGKMRRAGLEEPLGSGDDKDDVFELFFVGESGHAAFYRKPELIDDFAEGRELSIPRQQDYLAGGIARSRRRIAGLDH
jgi:hypothetical protein